MKHTKNEWKRKMRRMEVRRLHEKIAFLERESGKNIQVIKGLRERISKMLGGA